MVTLASVSGPVVSMGVTWQAFAAILVLYCSTLLAAGHFGEDVAGHLQQATPRLCSKG